LNIDFKYLHKGVLARLAEEYHPSFNIGDIFRQAETVPGL
jgi:hypothetical protein